MDHQHLSTTRSFPADSGTMGAQNADASSLTVVKTTNTYSLNDSGKSPMRSSNNSEESQIRQDAPRAQASVGDSVHTIVAGGNGAGVDVVPSAIVVAVARRLAENRERTSALDANGAWLNFDNSLQD